MFIKQISVFLENVKGSLGEFTKLLGEQGINLLALCIADTAGFGIARCIVKEDEIDLAVKTLREAGYIAKVNNVICLQVPHKPLAFSKVLQQLGSENIAVEYAYSFCRSTLDDAVLIIRPSDKDKCAAVLQQAGVQLVSQQEVNAF